MRIEILRSVLISGESVPAGSIIEVSRADAQLLIGSNKAQVSSAATPPSDEAVQPSEAPPLSEATPPASAAKRSRKPTPTPEA